MAGQLNVAIALWPGLEHDVLTGETLDRLRRTATVVDPVPLDLVSAGDSLLAEVDALLGGWGCPTLDGELLARLPRLRLLAYAAGSVKATVTDAVWERGIQVSSAAAANAVPVAELTFAAVVMIAKDVFRLRDALREGRGRGAMSGVGPRPGRGPVGTRGLRVGIVGASRIGRLVVDRLRTIDCEIALHDPYLAPDEARSLGAAPMGLDEICAWSDILSLHAPALPETRHLIDRHRLASMHDDAWLLNTARGSLVDTAALEDECSSGRLCAWIDTPDPEPLPVGSPLWDLPNVVLTPHIAGSQGTEVSRLGDMAVDEIIRFATTEPLHHRVHKDDLERIA